MIPAVSIVTVVSLIVVVSIVVIRIRVPVIILIVTSIINLVVPIINWRIVVVIVVQPNVIWIVVIIETRVSEIITVPVARPHRAITWRAIPIIIIPAIIIVSRRKHI